LTLIRQFNEGNEAAFTSLVERHADLVINICRRVLRDEQLAEDAFQATFLVFARKSRSLSSHQSIAGWLHQAARRTALKLRTAQQGSRQREKDGSDAAAEGSLDGNPERVATVAEVSSILDEELGRLKPQWREIFLLTQVEQLDRAEVAQRLGLTVPQVKDCLERAREQLRCRLLRRGITLFSAALAAWLTSGSAASAAGAGKLLAGTAGAAVAFSTGAVPAGLISPSTLGLAQGVLKMMSFEKIKMCLIAVLSFVTVGGLAYGMLHDAPDRFERGLRGTIVELRSSASVPNLTIHLDEFDTPVNLDLASDARVWLAFESRQLHDLKPGQFVSLRLGDDHRTIREIHVRGDQRHFAIQSIDRSGRIRVVEADDDGPAGDPVELKLAEDAILRIGGLPATREEFPPGTTVPMELSADGSTVNAIEAEADEKQLIFGTIVKTDPVSNSLTVSWEREDDQLVEQSFPFSKNAIILLDGKPATLASIPPGSSIQLRLQPDGATIQSLRSTSPVAELEDDK
jgi:RNA polymerase sigma factor (sigma-70 family)